jgi:S-(hydroxymethyl)glutathione dehydrogenase/alcohol dehydrogenase
VAVVVGLAPKGVEASLPAIEFLSEKTIRGSYYGSTDMHVLLPGLLGLLANGDLDVGEVVSDLIELDDIEAALGRLRRGEGARSVVIVDASLAGASAAATRPRVAAARPRAAGARP